MMIQNHLPARLIHRWNDSIGSIQYTHWRVIVNRIDCEETCRRNLLLRPDDDETGHSTAGGLYLLRAGPREGDECKTENESGDEPFSCHNVAGPFSPLESSLATYSQNPLLGSWERCAWAPL